MKKAIPIGVNNYQKLYAENFYVVDKTLMIKDFLERKSEVTLITRPRRFGKTSNMSMMAEFFNIQKNSSKLFEDTNIMETEYIKEMNQYPVIFLSFANCKGTYEAMKKKLFETLRSEYAKYRPLFEKDVCDADVLAQVRDNYCSICEAKDLVKIDTSIKVLSRFLYEVTNKRVMIFIDEYDTPFIEAHVNGYYGEIRGVLSSLLHSALKDNEYLQYAMLTGIQRVAKENIFSDLNNLKVFTVKNKEYAQYFGFTTEETMDLLEYYDLTLNDEVKAMYNGYRMGGIDIYNPWSIINYADEKKLIPFWVNTSSNMMIKLFMKQSDESFKAGYESLIKQGYLDTQVIMDTSFYEDNSTSNLWGLFVNAGYLTIENVNDIEEDECRLRIPNREILKEFKALTASYLNVEIKELSDLSKSLKSNNQEAFIKIYRNLIMKHPSYNDLKDENSYHMFLLGICLYVQNEYEVSSNREGGKGRYDILLKAKNKDMPSFVIEFKYTKEINQLETLAFQAVNQIKAQKYDTSLKGEIIYVGLAHCGKEVAIQWV